MNLPHIFAAREGFVVHGTEALYGRPIVELNLWGIDLSINRTVILMMAATAITMLLFFVGFRRPALVPRGLQNVMEYIVDFVKNQIVLPVMGPKGLPFLPYLTLLFMFILISNLFGTLPGVNFPVNSRIAVPMVLAIATWLLFVGVGVKQHGLRYFKQALVPAGVPGPLLIVLVPIEFISTFVVRPITLMLRLCINMIVGHLILVVLFIGTAYLVEVGNTRLLGVGTVVVGAGFVAFELFVAGLQAFIFTILTAVYVSGSLESQH